jgi:hypothetical protein
VLASCLLHLHASTCAYTHMNIYTYILMFTSTCTHNIH